MHSAHSRSWCIWSWCWNCRKAVSTTIIVCHTHGSFKLMSIVRTPLQVILFKPLATFTICIFPVRSISARPGVFWCRSRPISNGRISNECKSGYTGQSWSDWIRCNWDLRYARWRDWSRSLSQCIFRWAKKMTIEKREMFVVIIMTLVEVEVKDVNETMKPWPHSPPKSKHRACLH